MNRILKTYTELSRLPTFESRLEYCHSALNLVGGITFGGSRYLNQILYKSRDWENIRRLVTLRDSGSDLGLRDYPILGKIIVHHMNPISIDDILERSRTVFDPDYLISCSEATHRFIHYGNKIIEQKSQRAEGDTKSW